MLSEKIQFICNAINAKFEIDRGQEGSAKIDVNLNTTAKTVSRLSDKYDAYDALGLKNQIVGYELGTIVKTLVAIASELFIKKNQYSREIKY